MSPFLQWLVKLLNPQQICILCLTATVGIAGYGVRALAEKAGNKDVIDIKVQLLQKSLLDLRIEQCKAIKAGQSAAFYAGLIQAQAAKYYELTSSQPPLPGCGEI